MRAFFLWRKASKSAETIYIGSNHYLIRSRDAKPVDAEDRRFVCNNLLQRYPDSVRYSGGNSAPVSEQKFPGSCISALWESRYVKGSKTKRACGHARARVFREQIFPAISPSSFLGPCTSTRVRQVALPRVELHLYASLCICKDEFTLLALGNHPKWTHSTKQLLLMTRVNLAKSELKKGKNCIEKFFFYTEKNFLHIFHVHRKFLKMKFLRVFSMFF